MLMKRLYHGMILYRHAKRKHGNVSNNKREIEAQLYPQDNAQLQYDEPSQEY